MKIKRSKHNLEFGGFVRVWGGDKFLGLLRLLRDFFASGIERRIFHRALPSGNFGF